MTWEGTYLGSVILAPLVGSVLAFVLCPLRRWIALLFGLVTASAAVGLTLHVYEEGVLQHSVGGWGAPLGIDLRADGLSAFMLIVTAGVSVIVGLYTRDYLVNDFGKTSNHFLQDRFFWPLWLFLWASLNALFLSSDLFNLYVTLEMLGLSAVSLVALAGKEKALTAAFRYLMVSLSGSLFYLMGIALTYGAHATVDISLLGLRVQPGIVSWAALVLMTVGLLMKAALFPVHFWLPPAHANAPAPVSAVLSALVVKGAFFILLRIWFEAYRGVVTAESLHFLGFLGALAIIWGSIQALIQTRLKLLVAYSTVAQLGYLFLALPLMISSPVGSGAWKGALIFLGGHACAKTAMFLSAGNLLIAAGRDRIEDLDGITHRLPISVFAFGLAGISLVGLPPSTGFMGKWLLLESGLAQGQWFYVVVVLVGSLLAAAYLMRVLTHAFTREEEEPKCNPISPRMEWICLSLALLAVLLGLFVRWPLELLEVGAPTPDGLAGGG
jgi:formate hydrogenlyase subunit 3/multisubunit Na+/H+ antiporter MnhD subunit